MVPLISSLCYGPLGYCQMPRTWWKSLLYTHGKLAEDYPPCTKGLDHWWLGGFLIEDEEMLEFVASEKPDYLAFEAWVEQTARRKPNALGRESWNAFIETRIHRPSKFFGITEELGLDPATDLMSAVILNHQEDWHYFSERDFSKLKDISTIPLISSIDYGRLGVCQLPRTWLKLLLESDAKLHPDYLGFGGGLDAQVLKLLNLDRDDTIRFVASELPSYIEFENWISAQPDVVLDARDIEEWNAYITNREHNREKQEALMKFLNLPEDQNITSAVVLNNLEDWAYAFRQIDN